MASEYKPEPNVAWKNCICGEKAVVECASCNEFVCDECAAGTLEDSEIVVCHGCVIESLVECP